MTTYVYNTNPISTILFKGGHIEIKPQSYIQASDVDVESGVFKSAEQNGQVSLYTNKDDIPVSIAKAVEIQIETLKPTLAAGMDEEQYKEFLKKKAETPEPPRGKVTLLGQPPEVPEVPQAPQVPVEPKIEEVKVETTETPETAGTSEVAAEPKSKKAKK